MLGAVASTAVEQRNLRAQPDGSVVGGWSLPTSRAPACSAVSFLGLWGARPRCSRSQRQGGHSEPCTCSEGSEAGEECRLPYPREGLSLTSASGPGLSHGSWCFLAHFQSCFLWQGCWEQARGSKRTFTVPFLCGERVYTLLHLAPTSDLPWL